MHRMDPLDENGDRMWSVPMLTLTAIIMSSSRPQGWIHVFYKQDVLIWIPKESSACFKAKSLVSFFFLEER